MSTLRKIDRVEVSNTPAARAKQAEIGCSIEGSVI